MSTLKPTTVAFHLQANMVLVEVELNGEPKQFLVDTGAAVTLVGAHVAEELELKTDKKLSGMGAGGEAEFSMARVESLSVGGLTMRDLSCVVGDLEAINVRIGGGLDGVLGYDFLSRCRVIIDYRGGQITFEPYGDHLSRPNAFVIEGRRYRSESWGIALERPRSWRFETDTPLPTTLVILERENSPAKIIVDVMEVRGLTIQQMVPSIEASLALQIEHYEKLRAGEAVVAGEPAHFVEFEGTRDAIRVRCRYYGLKQEEISYSILFQAPFEDFPALVPEFEAIVEHVEILPVTEGES